MTSLPAQILGLADRGQILKGFAGDVVLFDPAKVFFPVWAREGAPEKFAQRLAGRNVKDMKPIEQ